MKNFEEYRLELEKYANNLDNKRQPWIHRLKNNLRYTNPTNTGYLIPWDIYSYNNDTTYKARFFPSFSPPKQTNNPLPLS